jgi:hypothetical protein
MKLADKYINVMIDKKLFAMIQLVIQNVNVNT